ncbi:hypothetical protein [Streptomyces filamentosus]|uniref:hypothetical protein n=1 Tax=Streptomyces filamentosus TaxID=67294 RepID=UPI00340F6FAF
MSILASTVYVKDPDTHGWVICDAGTEPDPRLAVLIRTPSAWEGGVLPELDPDDTPPLADEPALAAAEEPGPPEPAPEEPGPSEPAAEEPDKKPRTRRSTAKAAD